MLRRLLNFGKNNELIKINDIKWNLKKLDNLKEEILTDEQIDRLIDVCWRYPHPVAGLMVLLALYTGLRRIHILTLTWDRIDLDARMIRPVRMSAEKNVDVTPLSDLAVDVFKKIPRMSPKWVFASPVIKNAHYNPNGLRRHFFHIKAQAKIPANFRLMHGLRHTFATRATKIGGIFAAQGLLHHKDPATTQRYAHYDFDAYAQVSQQVADSFRKNKDKKPTKMARLPKI